MRWVAFSSVFAGLSGYAIILLATSTFGADHRFEIFNVFWGLFFALHGILLGIMHETTRAVRVSTGGADAGDDPTADLLLTDPVRAEQTARRRDERARPLPVAFGIGLVTGGLVAATSPLWAWNLLGAMAPLGVALASVALTLVAVQAVLFGLLSGSGRWSRYGKLLCVEALARIGVAGIAIVSGDPLAGFLYATVAGVVVVPVILLLPGTRTLVSLRADVRRGELARRTLGAMLAASAAAMLVVGFPVLIKAARPDTDPVVMSNLLLAVTLTRAPILMPITSFQNAIVVYFVDRASHGRRVLLGPCGIVFGVAVIGSLLAWLIGEPIIAFMGEGFSVGGQVLAALTFAAGFTGMLFVTGSAVLARERHGVYVAGWWTASIAAAVLLVVVPGAVVATVLALSAGPLAGALVHVAFGMRRPAGGAEQVPHGPAGVVGAPRDLEPTGTTSADTAERADEAGT
ncbi:membrane protein [Pseudoclavibacter endophyticus]|uniref:Polysaccharide biosynthesis protein n=1 Tax=Pseudoclavibacter endophyticus TaxID=1778590 RepID=A0A6H9WG34_9MICO|nr:polysaccharide biosynthesis protein [Pseudoclavibacter endophyticus]KAB1647884.1 polysaccharide biosynthesis protein [Pseudoclavibacter endophyticus]GGA73609.1 membrane protein [Pseudoclavibacter endophyticus]